MIEEKEPQKPGKYLTLFQRKILQKSLETENISEKYRQRIRIMLLADEGKNQTEISKTLKCSLVTAKYWMMFASTGQAHQWQSHPLGRPKSVNEKYLERLKELIHKSPQEVNVPGENYKYPYQRWTAKKLGEHLSKELGITISDRHVRRLLNEMGLSTKKQANKTKSSHSESSSYNQVLIKDLDPSQSADNPDLDFKSSEFENSLQFSSCT